MLFRIYIGIQNRVYIQQNSKLKNSYILHGEYNFWVHLYIIIHRKIINYQIRIFDATCADEYI